MIRRLGVLAALLAVLGAAPGCASDGDGPAAAPAVPSSAAPQPAPSFARSPSFAPPPSAAVPPGAGRPATDPRPAGAETLTGTVTAGVEPDCLLLTGGFGSRLLVFDDPALRSEAVVGATVTVTGRAERGMLSTCQQGEPFIVTSLRAG